MQTLHAGGVPQKEGRCCMRGGFADAAHGGADAACRGSGSRWGTEAEPGGLSNA